MRAATLSCALLGLACGASTAPAPSRDPAQPGPPATTPQPPPNQCPADALRPIAAHYGDTTPTFREEPVANGRSQTVPCATLPTRQECEHYARSQATLGPGEAIAGITVASARDADHWRFSYLVDGKLQVREVPDDRGESAWEHTLEVKGHHVEPQSGERVLDPGGPPFDATIAVRASARAVRSIMTMRIAFPPKDPPDLPAMVEEVTTRLEQGYELRSLRTDLQSRVVTVELTCPSRP